MLDRKLLFSVPDLKVRGWTPTAIAKFLPEPDDTSPNPYYSRAGAPMKFWLKKRIYRVEKTKGFSGLAGRKNGPVGRSAEGRRDPDGPDGSGHGDRRNHNSPWLDRGADPGSCDQNPWRQLYGRPWTIHLVKAHREELHSAQPYKL